MDKIMELFRQIETKPETPSPISFLIVGLGNPGNEYKETRHNVGFRFLDALAEETHIPVKRAAFKALVGDGIVYGQRVLLLKPQTYMNASGEAVQEAASFYRIPTDHIIVISDDISLEPGRVRVRKKGSDGGQKGIRSTIKCLGDDGFPRIRIGVGAKPHPDYDLGDWVLGVPDPGAQKRIAATFPVGREGLRLMLSGKWDEAMQVCNGYRA